ncbi:MAG: hypothetical protein GXX96_36830 [Planctomycetaceae bacterium]|nr:hypothetical protein [Planctomycetaceae bacterium]
MMRIWIAVALLGASWMWGLGYYSGASGWLWSVLLLAGIALSAERPRRIPCRVNALLAIAAALPALWIVSWPYRAVPLLLVLGLTPLALGNVSQWIIAAGWGMVRSALVLGGQALALRGYALLTARCHDLPWPGPLLVAMSAKLVGADASADGTNVAIFSTSGPQRLGATWELVLDPVTAALFGGAAVLVCLWGWEDRSREFRRWLGRIGWLVLAFAIWIPVRLGLLLGLFLHREMRAPEDLKLTVMNQFFSPWVLTIVGLGAVVSLAWWVRREQAEAEPEEDEQPLCSAETRKRVVAAAAAVVAVGLATTLLVIDPVGSPRGGRVVFVERHSDWEPTDRAYDTESFGHDPSYSYTAIYRYCEQYFDVSRLQDDEKIDTARLADCDVLVIKTPTEPYSPDEVGAILRFVERGGGLLLVGEHTDFMRTGSCLNQIAVPMGFKFRPDNLFAVDDPYVQHVAPERFPHPAVRNVPYIRYAGSCSIDPGGSWGRAAVWNTGLWSLGADYNMDNYFPEAYYRPEMRYGAYIQLWETRYGKGRVLAFTDSTIFSNFSTFEPGKAEMMLDMLSWLNCRSLFDSAALRGLLRVAGVGVVALLVWLGATRFPRSQGAWLVWFSCAMLGYLVSTDAIAAWQQGGQPECERPLVRVVIDRTVSRVPLSEGGFTKEPNGYGLLEQWIPRLGHYTVRADGVEAFSGDVLVVISPTESVPEGYRLQLVGWVSIGGKLLVIDSPDSQGTTANSLLWPFGMSVNHASPAQGMVRTADSDWPGVSAGLACQIEGGEPFMWVGDAPVAAKVRHGDGTVTAIGFGSLMNNSNMGGMWTAEPGPAELKIYGMVFELIDSVVVDRPLQRRATVPTGGPDADSGVSGKIQEEADTP